MRAYKTADGPAIFRLRDHTDRLFRSAHIFGMKIPYTKDEIDAAQLACVRDNKLDSCYIRPIAFYGSHAMGVAAKSNPVRVAIAAWPWGAYLGAEGLEKGIRVKTSSFTRHHVNITMTGAKACANYLNSILANQEATHDGYDEALLLDAQGYVSEGSGENVFIVIGGELHTPDIGSGALKGITRDTVMTLARDLGLKIQRAPHPARRGLLRRRGIFHRHGRRGHADSRARQPRDRRRPPRSRSPRSCRRCISTRSTAAIPSKADWLARV